MELYRLRQQIVEHPFGTIKRTLGFTYFLTRGLENVKTENCLHVLTYNIKRVLNIFGIPELVRIFQQLDEKNEGNINSIPTVFNKFYLFLSKYSNMAA